MKLLVYKYFNILMPNQRLFSNQFMNHCWREIFATVYQKSLMQFKLIFTIWQRRRLTIKKELTAVERKTFLLEFDASTFIPFFWSFKSAELHWDKFKNLEKAIA